MGSPSEPRVQEKNWAPGPYDDLRTTQRRGGASQGAAGEDKREPTGIISVL